MKIEIEILCCCSTKQDKITQGSALHLDNIMCRTVSVSMLYYFIILGKGNQVFCRIITCFQYTLKNKNKIKKGENLQN
jgi:hypothetical protein